MTIKTTRWSPDTCGCVIEYQWDDTTSEATRVHTPVNIVSQCSIHSSFSTAADLYSHIMWDSQRKNGAYAILLAQNPNLTPEQYNVCGWSLVTRSSPDIHGHVRQLVINSTVVGLSGQQASIQSSADSQFGSGEVAVE